MKFEGESRYVTVDGIKAHYIVAGKGPPLLLLHGLGASTVTWRDNVGPLSQHFRVYALDLPGHGNSDKLSIEYDSTRIVRLLVLTIKALGIEELAIIGNSVGGALALMIALRHPDLVSKLVLVNSAALGREITFYLRLVSIPFLGKMLEGSGLNGTRLMLKKIFHDPRFVTQDLIDELSRSRSSPGAKDAVVKVIRNTVNVMGVRQDYVLADELQSLGLPLLVIWGREDRILPVSHAYRASEEAPTASVHVFDHCGHWPQMEKANAFNCLVSDFLSGSDKP